MQGSGDKNGQNEAEKEDHAASAEAQLQSVVAGCWNRHQLSATSIRPFFVNDHGNLFAGQAQSSKEGV